MPLSFAEMRESANSLSKSVAAGAWKDVEALLKRLHDHAEPTEEQIRSTKLGKTIGQLRKSSEARVSELARDIVNKWRKLVDAEKAKQKGNLKKKNGTSASSSSKSDAHKSGSPPASKPEGNEAGSPSASASPKTEAPTSQPDAASAQPKDEPPSQSAPPASKKPRSTTKIDFEILGDKVRNACLKLLTQSLEVDLTDDKVPAYETALDIEKAAFSKIGHGDVTGDYRNKIRSLSLNLKDKKNPGLRRGVIGGQIDPAALVTMTPEEMASDAVKAERQRLNAQNLFNARAAEPQEAETDMFECSRCHQRKVRYFEKQTRSADEPMTVFCTCTNCNFRWKFS